MKLFSRKVELFPSKENQSRDCPNFPWLKSYDFVWVKISQSNYQETSDRPDQLHHGPIRLNDGVKLINFFLLNGLKSIYPLNEKGAMKVHIETLGTDHQLYLRQRWELLGSPLFSLLSACKEPWPDPVCLSDYKAISRSHKITVRWKTFATKSVMVKKTLLMVLVTTSTVQSQNLS